MASNVNPNELKYLLECGICLNRFDDPRVLPCLHSYCLNCLKSHISSNKDTDGAFKCPQCRERCILPEGGADNFPKNFFMNTMKDVIPASSLKEPDSHPASSSAPEMCQNHNDTAVVFCTECDAHFCESCTTNHRLFNATKDHELIPVSGARERSETKDSPNCKLHQNQKVTWYCKTCSLPACSYCIIEDHNGHASEQLSIKEATVREDMLDVSKLAAKRLGVLQNNLASIASKKIHMNKDLDHVSKEISDTADRICRLVRQHETTLQNELEAARNTAKNTFAKAVAELETCQKNTRILKSSAETLHQAAPEQAPCTILQAPINKQQFLGQQEISLPSVNWHLDRRTGRVGQLSSSSFMGSVDVKSHVNTATNEFQEDNIILAAPVQTMKLGRKGGDGVYGIAPIYKSNLCIAHYDEKHIWVYTSAGQLEQKIEIPGISKITGMVTVDGNVGKLAIVDNRLAKVHFVTLSEKLKVIQHLVKDISITPFRISVNYKGDLVVCGVRDKKVKVSILNQDGEVLSTTDVHNGYCEYYERIKLYVAAQTKVGFVVCGYTGNEVYFSNADGSNKKTITNCERPRHAAQTSWGHVLIADYAGGEIRVFSERGEFLGNVHDNSGSITKPHYIHVDEAQRCLYVACGKANKEEVRTYTFAPSELHPLPITRVLTDVTVKVALINL